tara:strand:+ start:129 stop:467 length:339 start_codon:yes stop_codon:yes gene_type:complete
MSSDDEFKEAWKNSREYIPKTTVANVNLHIGVYRAYMNLETNAREYEIVGIEKEKFVAWIDSEDREETLEIIKKKIKESLKNWIPIHSTEMPPGLENNENYKRMEGHDDVYE